MRRVFWQLIVAVVALSISLGNLYAQYKPLNAYGNKEGNCMISGVVVDGQKRPVEYTSIAVYSLKDSILVSGAITDVNGKFEVTGLSFGKYWIEADFIGFEKKRINSIVLSPEKPVVLLPPVNMGISNVNIEGVEVIGGRPQVSYKIDKKVINVSQDINAQTGTAADVLENVPSVSVDIEGNVTLRGSYEFTVLINGRPNSMEGSDALQQIPASTIENIEIITNPSAKYDPDGTAGIINVITKKQSDKGLGGIINIGAGTQNNYKADIFLNYKKSKYALNFGLDYSKGGFEMVRSNERRTYANDTTYYLNSDGEMSRNRNGIKIKLGIDMFVLKNTTFGISGNAGTFDFGFGGNSRNWEKTVPVTTDEYFYGYGEESRDRNFYDVSFNVIHKFKNDDHKIEGLVFWSERNGEESNKTTEWPTDELWVTETNPFRIVNTIETDDDQELLVKLDYLKKINQDSKLEAGYQYEMDRDNEDYIFEEFDTALGWLNDPLYSSHMDFSRDIHSVYSTYQNVFSGIAYQVGLRIEYTYRSIKDQLTGTDHVFDKVNYFPSIHLSKSLLHDNEIYLNYSRRINRPRGWSLEPFTSYRDKNNLQKGNPDLKPEYIDSYELGWQKKRGSSFISLENYYRVKNNLITRIHTLQSNDIVLHTFENLNRDHSLGSELMINYVYKKWFTLNLSGTVYYYYLEGEIYSEEVNSESVNWDMRMSNTFRLSPNTRFQFNMNYMGPSVTVEGRREGFLMSDLGVKQDIMKRKMTASLQVRDLFSSMKREHTIEGAYLYEHFKMQHTEPMIMFTLSLKLNNYKPEKKEGSQMNGDDSGGEFEM